jgi:hypothetical protein
MKSLVLFLVACVAEREGVQFGEEKVEDPPNCEPVETPITPDEPTLELLDSLPLQATVTPAWDDGSDGTLTVDLTWASLRERTWVLVPEVESCPPDGLIFDLQGQIGSESGLLDEEVLFEDVLLVATEGGEAHISISPEDVGGSLDADAIAVEELGDIDRNVSVSVDLALVPGAPSHGEVSVFAGPDYDGPPASPDETIQREIAVW